MHCFFYCRTHLSFCFNFFLHGESSVCASIEVKQHPPVWRLTPQHLTLTQENHTNFQGIYKNLHIDLKYYIYYRQDGLRQVRAVSGTIAARKLNNWYREVRGRTRPAKLSITAFADNTLSARQARKETT